MNHTTGPTRPDDNHHHQHRYPDAARPRTGIDTAIALDHAIVALADTRTLPATDTAVQLHLLASLIAQAETWLAEQAETAQAQGATWAQIGRLIGLTATVARQQYAHRPATQPQARPSTTN